MNNTDHLSTVYSMGKPWVTYNVQVLWGKEHPHECRDLKLVARTLQCIYDQCHLLHLSVILFVVAEQHIETGSFTSLPLPLESTPVISLNVQTSYLRL